jgi:hypothetical protein
MHHDARWWRIAAYLMLLVLPLYVIFATQVGVAGYAQWQQRDALFSDFRQQWTSMSHASQQQYVRRYGPPVFLDKRPSGFAIAARVAFTPFAGDRIAEYVYSDQSVIPYQYNPRNISKSRWNRIAAWLGEGDFAMAQTLAFPIALSTLIAALFVLLPQTRRVSRVRGSHLVRITLYSFVFPVVMWSVCLGCLPSGYGFSPSISSPHWGSVAFIMLALVPLVLLIWWGTAISRHLRMRSPWLIASSLWTTAVLLLMVCGYFWLIVDMRPDWFMPSG